MKREAQVRACAVLGRGLADGWPAHRALRLAAASSSCQELSDRLGRAAAAAVQGTGLEQALRDQQLFAGYARALDVGGDSAATGRLLAALTRGTLERRRQLRELAGAGVYPLIVLLCAVAGAALIMHTVLPLVSSLRADADGLLGDPRGSAAWLGTVLGWPGGLCAALTLAFGWLAWRRAGLGARALVLRPLVQQIRAGLTDTLAEALRAEAKVPEAIELARAACPDPASSRAVARLAASSQQGQPLSAGLVRAGIVQASWRGPLELGEHGSRLPDALSGVSRVLSLEADRSLAVYKTMITTLLTLAAGALVALVGLTLFEGLY